MESEDISKEQMLQYISESLPSFPNDIVSVIYKIILYSESGIE